MRITSAYAPVRENSRLATALDYLNHMSLRQRITWSIVMGIWIVFVGMLYYAAQHTSFGLKVFEVYYRSAAALLQGDPIYSGTNGWIYLYPPLLSQLLIPIVATLDYTLASTIWLGINIALLVVTLTVLSRYVPDHWAKWLWLLPIAFIPIWQALYIGQVTIILFTLLTGVWVALREDRPVLAGMLLAFAAWLKVFPAVLILYFLWRRNTRLIAGVIVGGLGLAAFQILVSGPVLFVQFFEVLLSLTAEGQPNLTYENLSIFAFVSRLFQENVNVDPVFINTDLFRTVRIALTVLVIGISAFALYRSGRMDNNRLRSPRARVIASWRFDVEYALVLLTILMVGTTLWISGLPPLILIGLLSLRNRRHTHRKRTRMLWLMAFLLMVAYQPVIVLVNVTGIVLGPLPLSIGFIGLIIAWALMVWMLLFDPAQKEERSPSVS